MSELMIIAFDEANAAYELEKYLRELRAEMRIEAQDSAVLVRDEDGEVEVHQPYDAPKAQIAGGTVWGLVIGAAFALPLAGAAAGALTGAVVGQGRDPNVSTEFLQEIANTLKPGGRPFAFWCAIWMLKL